jgi:hypothetical protein
MKPVTGSLRVLRHSCRDLGYRRVIRWWMPVRVASAGLFTGWLWRDGKGRHDDTGAWRPGFHLLPA